MVLIRKAALRDVKTIHKIIGDQAIHGHLLPRAVSELYAQVRDFSVAIDDDSGAILACGALHLVWEDLAEVRSLAVGSAFQNKGLGGRLVDALLTESRQMDVNRVFVLTYRRSFFERLGFQIMDKGLLPHKIWADCIKCTKFPECDEIAMVKAL